MTQRLAPSSLKRRLLRVGLLWGAILLGFGLALGWGVHPAAAAGETCNHDTKTYCVVVNDVVTSSTWVSDTVYVLVNARIMAGTVVTVEEGTIIKIYAPNPLDPNPLKRSYLHITGTLNLQGTFTNPVIFTSYRDDTPAYGGDTNGDGTATQSAMSDYTEIRLTRAGTAIFQNAIVRYGHYGLRVYNDLGSVISPTISNVTFNNNFFGLTFDTASTGDILSEVQNNTFSKNMYGLGARTSGQGASRPNVVNNTFDSHNEIANTSFITPSFPIYLNGTAFPTYSGNTFAASNRHQAIALGGAVNRSGTWPIITDTNNNPLPYVIYGDVLTPVVANRYGQAGHYLDFRINASTTVTVPANAIFKAYVDPAMTATSQRYLKVYGTLDLQSTSDNDQILFTSWRDDLGGGSDTNADGSTSSPTVDNWQGVALYNSLTTLDYIRSRYAKYGVQVYNDGVFTVAIAPEIAHNVFEYNLYGIYLFTSDNYHIFSAIHDNVLATNTYGLGSGVFLHPNNVLYSGGSYPTLTSNQFNNNTGFPIYLGGTAFPAYAGSTNTFTGNTHPAIGLDGYFLNDGAWALVPGAPDVSGTNLPYVVSDTVIIGTDWCVIPPSTTPVPCGDLDVVTLPGTAVFKMDTAATLVMRAYGNLDMLSTSPADQITFTSYKDDSVVGDTNADITATVPAKGNWDSIIYTAQQFIYSGLTKVFNYALVKYATRGVQVSYNGPNAATNFLQEIHHVRFQENANGAYFYIDNAGDINASVHENIFISNTYGLTTDTDDVGLAIGAARPYVYSNTFQAQTNFPIYLGGTAFPVYNNAGLTLSVTLTNQFLDNAHPGVALGGLFNCTGLNCGDWAEVRYGSYRLPYVVIADVTVGTNSTVGVPPGTIIKLNTTGCTGTGAGGRCSITVKGELDTRGTASQPVVFTSYKDDSSGGDTNGDGSATTPGRSDWYALNLQSSGLSIPIGSYAFDHAVIKYAQQGLRVFATGAGNVFPTIADTVFTENNIGLQLLVGGTGNVLPPVSNNIFLTNTTAVLGSRVGSVTGKLFPVFFNNDLYGSFTTSNTFTISVPGSVVTATFNYWGAPSGPRHALLNPGGTGVVVTNTANSTVILDNYASGPYQSGLTYAILGRVAAQNDTPTVPQPLANVTLLLNTGVITVTNQNGNYTLGGLASGAYVVQPFLSGYAFTPVTRSVLLAGTDATGLDFVGALIIGQTYAVSGHVNDLNGQPLAGAFVYASSTSYGAFTNASGDFTLAILPGAYTLKAVKAGSNFSPLARPIMVTNAALTGQDFQEAIFYYIYLPLVRR